ncbi:hypothetical protein OJF2_30400 [Aquisphaera giovannonii]|uniref:Uncharacterized protein n=1 Tax=Aquisphaera giovannonii TaxID=406548 RepID=A0A5B9W336_9BACT|nr:hypothetical protein [Aquisphaera giovannonii]QEH34501.1 hypothetical protein OJF2_30400 [Aquisphaera giovannonii]
MATEDRGNPGMLDILDTALIGAIKGAVWLPLVALPRLIQRTLPSVVKLLRVAVLAAVWLVLVFGPLPFLDGVDDPILGFALAGWTVVACLGSAIGLLRLRRIALRRPGPKPRDLREAFA